MLLSPLPHCCPVSLTQPGSHPAPLRTRRRALRGRHGRLVRRDLRDLRDHHLERICHRIACSLRLRAGP